MYVFQLISYHFNSYLLVGSKVTLYTPRRPRDNLFCVRRRSEQNNSSRVAKVYKAIRILILIFRFDISETDFKESAKSD